MESTLKNVDMAKAYQPQAFEDRIYRFWLDSHCFSPESKNNGQAPYVIVIPPPNVTGVLHMGHGLNNSLQDVLVRYNRMLGRPTLWVPGTDHAGIATQNVVERRLKDKGLSKHDLGREEFIRETWLVKEEHQTIIRKQLQKIGASCDWSRERFTLDEGLSQAVREVFVNLYEKDLIYKGNYLVNWCTTCGTALADDEVEHEELEGRLYYYFYPLSDGSGKLTVATTRPETMLGDTAVAVNPQDERYTSFIGKTVDLPLTGRRIPVITDAFVSMDFGTGVVKVTPGHDQNDWEMGNRHRLDKINIINENGSLNMNVPKPYRGLSVKEARQRVVADLKEAGVYVKDDRHLHQVGHCYRCHTVIEPYLSTQWFVRMKPLAEQALVAWEQGLVSFYPKKWENTYAHWMRNIRDWCISRQLWWGHRIPVWYCADCTKVVVSREDPTVCPQCSSASLTQDPDVLDTWFSSWLWPFSTLGWPQEHEDFKRYYPTSTLVTAYDIIFFWVARMIMAGMEFTGKAPFADVYLHGLVRDKQGRKMSKSLGNGIDPLDIINEYGADAFKFTLVFLAAMGQDILMDKDTFAIGSKFTNKVWNASRYLLMNLNGRNILAREELVPTKIDRWIWHRLNETIRRVKAAFESYRFNEAATECYEYFWNNFCDWYIEASKLSLYCDDEREKDRAVSCLLYVLEESLRLVHPLLSFISEEIYSYLPDQVKQGHSCIALADFPQVDSRREAADLDADFRLIQDLVRGVRTLRSEFTLATDKKIKVIVRAQGPVLKVLAEHMALIESLIGAGDFKAVEGEVSREGSVPVVGSGFQAYVYIKELIDLPREIAKLEKEYAKLSTEGQKTAAKLSNAAFLDKAPDQVVQKEREKLADYENRRAKLKSFLGDLKN